MAVEDSVAKLRQEIENTVMSHGAEGYVSGIVGNKGFIEFKIRGRQIRMGVEMPPVENYAMTPEKHIRRSPSSQKKAWEEDCRGKWHSILMLVKAKLYAIEQGTVLLENEFLAYTVLPSRKTVGQVIGPQIEEAYISGGEPSLLPEGLVNAEEIVR